MTPTDAARIRRSFLAGCEVGAIVGIFVGCVLGAIAAWAAGAVLEWLRQLSFTEGVALALLPFGDRADVLEWVADSWYIVIPGVGIGVGAISAAVGGLAGAVVDVTLGPADSGMGMAGRR